MIDEPQSDKILEMSGSGTGGIVALVAFFFAVATTIIGVCLAGAWMVVGHR